jgi:hypothetical protein
MTVHDYIQEKYNRTKWNFIPLVEILNKFGESARDELNELRKQGLIKRREGGNGPVIEYLPNNTNNETT